MTKALSGTPDSDQIIVVFQKYIDGAKSGHFLFTDELQQLLTEHMP